MAIKLIAIDIDGTLINSQHEITAYTEQVIQRAKVEGIKIVLCTGRPFISAQKYVQQLQLDVEDGYLITYNGALTQETNTGNIINHIGLTGKDYKIVAQLAQLIGAHFQAFDFEAIYTSDRDISCYTGRESYMTTMPILYRTLDEIDDSYPFTKLMFIDEEPVLDRAIAAIPAHIHEQYTIVKSEAFYCEVLNKKASKGQAIKHLISKLNIAQHEVMTIGDHPNDFDMIQFAGIGVAMGNAVDEIKEIADYITATNDENGVAQAIEKFAL